MVGKTQQIGLKRLRCPMSALGRFQTSH